MLSKVLIWLGVFIILIHPVIAKSKKIRINKNAWEETVGQAGADGWKAHVIQPDLQDHGPDGFNTHDWDGDGELDIFVNFEEGGYSRLYFNPGKEHVRQTWTNFIELKKHGKCEDSSIGDLDGDGDIDYVANGGHIYFNPGRDKLRKASEWKRVTLFESEARCPLVYDVDRDGLNDLIVAAKAWYKQPKNNKLDSKAWKRFEIGKSKWPMNSILHDMDGDGDKDLIVQDRRQFGTFYYENPGKDLVYKEWKKVIIDPQLGGMFMALGDVNNDNKMDIVVAAKYIKIFLRKNEVGKPDYQLVKVAIPKQPKSVKVKAKPKGVAILDMNSNPKGKEIVIIPEYEAQLWYLSLHGDGFSEKNWKNKLMDIPAPETRKKMDNAYLADIDGDGDLDIATTEENGGWGILWFENPRL